MVWSPMVRVDDGGGWWKEADGVEASRVGADYEIYMMWCGVCRCVKRQVPILGQI